MSVKEQKNYITPQGLEKLQKEYKDLKYRERPEVTKAVAWAASNGDRSENGDYIYGKKKLREIDRRLHFLSKRIDAAEIIDPGKQKFDHVSFGATVTIRDQDDKQKTYTIVGADETDLAKGRISWLSPLAAALLKAKAREGDWIEFKSPKGEQEIEVVALSFRAIED